MIHESLLFENVNSSAGAPCDFSSEYIKDLLKTAVEIMQKSGAEYADALFERTWGIRIQKDKAEEQITAPPSLAGIVLRAYKGGEWKETGICDLDKYLIASKAEQVARFNPTNPNPLKLSEYSQWQTDQEIPVKIDPKNIPIEEKLAVVRDTHKLTSGLDPRINNVRVVYLDSTAEKIFANTEGSLLRQVYPRTRFQIVPFVREGGKQEYDFLNFGGVCGFEIAKNVSEQQIREIVDSTLELLKAVKPPSGEFPVILDQGLCGMFAHESFGHGCEADQVVRKRSYLSELIGKSVGPEYLTIYDDGSYQSDNFVGGHGSFVFDDEGAKVGKTIIVENGILKELLHERYSASSLGKYLTGNGRRENFTRKIFVRMTNTCIKPSDYSLEEMKEGFTGIMLTHAHSGMEDPLAGGLQLKCKKGYMIENGEQTKVYSMLSLSGNVLDFLANIEAIGKAEYFKMSAGSCSKGHEDTVPVGDGGSYIMSKAMVSTG